MVASLLRGSEFLNQKSMKPKRLTLMVLGLLSFGALGVASFAVPGRAFAATQGSVVINEVAWAGSADSANDEWIELYNTSSAVVDLSGWTINDDQGQSVYALAGNIAAHGYYLIEDSQGAAQPNVANIIINVSLANTGDSLVLFDVTGQVVDSVNSSGGAWFAGNSTTRATMERIDSLASGDISSNWISSNGAGSSATASAGSQILGTPGMLNSQSQTPATQTQLAIISSSPNPNVGESITLNFNVENANNLFSYGLEITYDPAVLTYVSSAAGNFLSASGTVPTSFQASLENNVPGKLLLAEARTQTVKSGVSGSGTVASATFQVTSGAGSQTQLQFGQSTFLADVLQDMSVQKSGTQISVQNLTAPSPATNITANEDAQAYALKLQWVAAAGGVDKYRIYRRNAHGAFVQLGETTQLQFVDSDVITAGGAIVPQMDYSYRVTAVKGGAESIPVSVQVKETRGLKGDNNRTGRIDGRDLENLARHFAQTDADSAFDPLVDTTYDAQIDGSDLIDLGLNFGRTYP